MGTYSVYDNILIKLESIYLKVEMEVDREITALVSQATLLNQQLNNLKNKAEVLNTLKRSFDLYCDRPDELCLLARSLLKILSDKQIQLRILQEKEVLLHGYTLPFPEVKLPSVIEINKELKLRKQLQEIELLSSFLADHPRFENYLDELEKANGVLDLSIESGAMDKLEAAVDFCQHFFEKVLNFYNLDPNLLDEFKSFREQIILQAHYVSTFKPESVNSLTCLEKTYKETKNQRVLLEREVENLLYQFGMFSNGKKIILLETKNITGELESLIFKEYAVKQKIQELKQYKFDLNLQKQCFMRDPTVDGYLEAVKQLELIESRFNRLTLYKNMDKQNLANRFFAADKPRVEKRITYNEQTPYNKILFMVLHNTHITSEDKAIILRISKPSKLINTCSGKFFYQRTAKTRSVDAIVNSFKKCHNHELH